MIKTTKIQFEVPVLEHLHMAGSTRTNQPFCHYEQRRYLRWCCTAAESRRMLLLCGTTLLLNEK